MHGSPLSAGYHWITSQKKVSRLVRSLVLSSPNFRIHVCIDSKSVPPVPELPESLRATDSTVSSVISTGIKI